MHASYEYKISALLKGGAESAQRLIESLRPLGASLAPAALRSHWEQLLDRPAFSRWVEPHAALSEKASLQVAVGVGFASMAMSIALGTHFDGVLDVHARTPNAGVLGLLFDLVL